jgi:hypothetical protein
MIVKRERYGQDYDDLYGRNGDLIVHDEVVGNGRGS